MTRLIIRHANAYDKEAWDIYVYTHKKATPYQLYGWKDAVERAYGHQPCYLIAEENGIIVGVLPLFSFAIPFKRKSLISLPFCDIGDALANDDRVESILITKAFSLLSDSRARCLEIRSGRERYVENDNGSIFNCIKRDKVRMLLDLPPSSEELWKGFKSKLRSQIKKAEKNELYFEWGSIKNIDSFYQVFSKNMHDLGSPVHSKRWIYEILNGYGENAKLGLVYHLKRVIGGGIILCTQHSVSIPWASTLREYNYLAPNMMLYWNFLKFASDSGRKLFDFGRSTLNEGTFRFKKQWGAKPAELQWLYTEDVQGRKDNAEQHNSIRKKVEALWKKIPLFCANIIGPLIRKYVSL